MTRPDRRVIFSHNEDQERPWRQRAGNFLSPLATDLTNNPLLHNALVATLRADESKYALRPADPHFLTSMAAAVSGAVDAGVPVRSLRQDNRRWAECALFCDEFMGTDALRPDCASISHDADALAREQFLLAAFVIWRYGRMVPRSNASPQAKPSSVRPYVDTVRNVHARRGITLACAPVVSRVIKGLLKNYCGDCSSWFRFLWGALSAFSFASDHRYVQAETGKKRQDFFPIQG